MSANYLMRNKISVENTIVLDATGCIAMAHKAAINLARINESVHSTLFEPFVVSEAVFNRGRIAPRAPRIYCTHA